MIRLAWLAGVIVVLLFVGLLSMALARDPDGKWSEAPYHEWYKSQYNANGQWCCDKSDGHAYYGEYTVNSDGSVTIGKRTLPAYMVLKGPNPTGHAVWWFMEGYGGHIDYCFAPGSMG